MLKQRSNPVDNFWNFIMQVNEMNARLYQIKSKKFGILGYLAVDNVINGYSTGGLRMDAQTSIEELKALARTMTLKYAFIGFPRGGAKAVLLFDAEKITPMEKKQILTAAGKHLSPLLKSFQYRTGTDLGTTDEDILLLLQAAGVEKRATRNRSGFYTALTVFLFSERLSHEIGLDPKAVTVAIEGFGKVGSNLAGLFYNRGIKVVAVSTREGAVYSNEGLDIHKLIELNNIYGSQCIHYIGNVRKINKEDLLTLPVDILCPCAKSWSINKLNVHAVKAKLIVPGANIPVTREAEEVLIGKNTLFVPDFAANCGGVFSGILASINRSDEKVEKTIKVEFMKKVESVLLLSKQKQCCLSRAAAEIAMSNFYKAKSEERQVKGLIYRFGLYCNRKGYIPEAISKLLSAYYIRLKLKRL